MCTTIGGGGGAAGPNGDGGDASGTTGGSGGTGSGGAGGSNGNAGGNGTEWDATHGSGGGGGATGAGGLYGGGKGGRNGFGAENPGAQGIIVITYTTAEVPARVLRLQGVRFLGHVRLYGIGSGGEVSQDWYNGSWSNRVLLTIDNTEVNADLTDFPVYVDLSDLPAGFHTNVKSDGSDIRVTTSDGTTEVPREVVFYDAGTDTGELHFKAPSLSNATDTEFYIYYGNAGASDYATSDTYGAENVWTNNYEAVYHLQGVFTDSTANSQDGTNNGSTANASGQLGAARSFSSGSSQYITLTDIAFGGTSPISVQAWGNPTSLSANMNLVAQGTEIVLRRNAGNIEWILNTFTGATDRITGAHGMTTGNWYSFTGTYSSSDGMDVYAAGTNVATGTPTGTYANAAANFEIGRLGNASEYWNGSIDEVRILSQALTAEWIATEYSNQNAPNTFYTVGSEE